MKQNKVPVVCDARCVYVHITGRKLKRFGALKALGMTPSMMFQSHLAMSGNSQALTSMSCIPGIREVQFSHPISGILENIEPETVYAEYDSNHSMVPHMLLSSLNRLCEKQLLWIVRWSKSLPGNAALQLGGAISWQALGEDLDGCMMIRKID